MELSFIYIATGLTESLSDQTVAFKVVTLSWFQILGEALWTTTNFWLLKDVEKFSAQPRRK